MDGAEKEEKRGAGGKGLSSLLVRNCSAQVNRVFGREFLLVIITSKSDIRKVISMAKYNGEWGSPMDCSFLIMLSMRSNTLLTNLAYWSLIKSQKKLNIL